MGIYNIGAILRGLRKSRGFSQKQLAEGTCTVEYISKMDKEFDKARELAIRSLLITKPEFTTERLPGRMTVISPDTSSRSIPGQTGSVNSCRTAESVSGKPGGVLASLWKRCG